MSFIECFSDININIFKDTSMALSVNFINNYKEIVYNNSADSLYSGQTGFNKSVVIGNDIITCYNMFSNCTNFDSPVVIGNNVTNCSYMFHNCTNFNQPINIPDSVTNCYDMFANCYAFNQPINISNKVTDCRDMFYNCGNFNQPINIPNKVTNCFAMFFNCMSMSSDIKFLGEPTYIGGMLYLRNNSSRINVYCSNIACLNKTAEVTSITSYAITWTATTNGYYNAATNIYILNNVGWR